MDEVVSLEVIEQRIGYRFQDSSLLARALVHASVASSRQESNERLEFLGDAVLGAVVCEHLYRRRNLPQVTPIVAALAFSGAVVSILGYAAHAAATALLVALLVADLLIITLAVRQLVCYRCGAMHEGVRIARYHRPWDRTMADKVAREEAASEEIAATAQATAAEPSRETREAT